MTTTAQPEGNNNGFLLSVENLEKAYRGKKVVNNVHLGVHPQEIVGLLGPNGAGKTTTFYMIVGLEQADAGSIHFNNQEITGMPMYKRARRGMGYLAQEPSVFRHLSVKDNIVAILETLDLEPKQRDARLKELLRELQLEDLADQKAATLSGGERRRVEITRALATDPAFIMLDEPFSGVDPINVYEVQKIIAHLRDIGLGVLITDHNVRETLAVVQRAYLICSGKILCEGTSDFLINDEQARRLYLGPRFTA